MKRRHFLKTTAVLTAGTFLNRCTAPRRRPNIMLIFTDQQTYRAMSCTGNTWLKTPAMDRLAAEGMRFDNAYCTSPVCSPARSTLVSGLMPHTTGVEWNGQTMHPHIKNMGQLFQHNGYRTVWAGKWHLPESFPLRAGSKQKEIDGFELLPFYDSTKNWPEWGYGDVTDEPLAKAIAGFLSQPQDKPWLMGVSFLNPHDCCYLTRRPERYKQADEIDEPLPPLPDNHAINPNEPQFLAEKRQQDHYGDELLLSKDWGERKWRAYLWNYYRMTERVDAAINTVLTALDDNGLTDNTLVIFTSDHGDGVASHRWTAKLSLYEESVRIPFIMRYPQHIPANQTDRDHLISQLDVLPTFCDYSGIPLPDSLRGKSIRPIIEQPRSEWRDAVVTELADDNKDTSRKGRMVRTTQYKYNIYSHGKNNEQLFDLTNDPGETNNLAYMPDMQSTVDQHRHLLKQWMQKTNDTFEQKV